MTRPPLIGAVAHNSMVVVTSHEAAGAAPPQLILGSVVQEQIGYPRLALKQHTAPLGAEHAWTAADSLPPTPNTLQSHRKEPLASD